ncbi:MAG TPA: hypothetical protein DDY20_13055 [Desulfobulbaceae bacterium]|nr:hypothetical protein [Desulfobulbaceae bacterium]
MDSGGADYRRYRRIYFPDELAISGLVAEVDTHKEHQVKVLNLSEGGLFFTLAREEAGSFREKGSVLFIGLRGPDPFTFSQILNMEIKWVCDNEIMENIGFGCEFVDPPSGFVKQIRDLVAGFPMYTG